MGNRTGLTMIVCILGRRRTSSSCHEIGRSSSGMPDQASLRSSAMLMLSEVRHSIHFCRLWVVDESPIGGSEVERRRTACRGSAIWVGISRYILTEMYGYGK
jgi:hypothetical protein